MNPDAPKLEFGIGKFNLGRRGRLVESGIWSLDSGRGLSLVGSGTHWFGLRSSDFESPNFDFGVRDAEFGIYFSILGVWVAQKFEFGI